MLCAKLGWNGPSGSGMKDFLNFVNVFSMFCYLPLKKWVTIHLNKFKFPSPKDALYKAWSKFTQWFWGTIFFKITSMYFSYFNIFFPWTRTGPFIWTNLNPLLKGMLCAKFGPIEPLQWSRRRLFLYFRQSINPFSLLSPLGKGKEPSFEQTWIPFTQGCFVPSLVEIDRVIGRRRQKCEGLQQRWRQKERRRTTDKFLSWDFG